MTLEPLNLASLLSAVMWPAIVLIALTVFRSPLGNLINVIGQRIDKVSFAGMSLDLAKASELEVSSVDTDLRELDAGTRPQSGPIDLLFQVRNADNHDYIVIDLGSDSARRWLTSRLYLFGLILSRVSRLKCFVFVETTAGIRNRFIGVASPDDVRWAFARRYPWLEYAYARCYALIGLPQFDETTGWLVERQATGLLQNFLAAIRVGAVARPFPEPLPFTDINHPPESIDLGNGVLEYAKWLDAARVERVVGRALRTSSITIPPGKDLDDMVSSVLKVKDRFVAIVESDRTFRGLIDRSPVLEHLGTAFAKRSADQ